jgi:type II secretory pathway predicted ATPase ExeA
VLVVDEAQNLAPEVLEQVRLLTNLETATQKLLQIILIGQPELRESWTATTCASSRSASRAATT